MIVLFALCACVLLLSTVSDTISLTKVLTKRRSRERCDDATPARPHLLFLVPAHNEKLLIEGCVRSLVALNYPAERRDVVVIADNCTDETAALARAAGARCLERTDAVMRGKPRAIAWALEQLEMLRYDAVVIVDADTVVDRDFAVEIAKIPDLRSVAAQGLHGVLNPNDTSITRMAAVFAAARYDFEFPLKSAGGLTVPLMGNGMCLGADVLAKHGWMAFSICEDWEMYTRLTWLGVRIVGVPSARLYSQEARSLSQSASQRKRWAAGKITVLLQNLGPLLRSREIGGHQKLDTISELTIPGPVVHLGFTVVLMATLALLSPPGAAVVLVALALPIVRTGLYTVAAIRRERDPMRTIAAFFYLPLYLVWRLWLQLSALTMLGDKPWIRTERHT